MRGELVERPQQFPRSAPARLLKFVLRLRDETFARANEVLDVSLCRLGSPIFISEKKVLRLR